MALHPTPSLSFGSPPPPYRATDGTQMAPADVAAELQSGGYVHVADQEAAEAVMAALGLPASDIQHRLDVAYGIQADG